ncbi:MAG TPA: DUF2892 domain-containing protein [Polyangiaceae bacterium]|jgi:hypothetical protein|nr:DUF2892 domain-containing protein [Polyangiaceae bacterium]
MKQNLGRMDRVVRAVAAIGLAGGAVAAPLPWAVRVVGLGASAVYLLFTVLAGTCLGYRLMGLSTCPNERA